MRCRTCVCAERIDRLRDTLRLDLRPRIHHAERETTHRLFIEEHVAVRRLLIGLSRFQRFRLGGSCRRRLHGRIHFALSYDPIVQAL